MARNQINMARTTAGTRKILIPIEKGLLFDGSDDFLTCPITPSTDGFCIAFWLYRVNANASTSIVSYRTDATNDGFAITRNSLNRLVAQVFNASTVTASLSNPNGAFPIGGWHHYILTFKPNEAKIYLDRVLAGTDTSCSMTAPTGATLTMGKNSYAGSGFSANVMKDFIFQNTATPWTQTEIDDLFYKRVIPTGADVWYKLNENVTDSSSNSNDGTLTGGTYSTNVPSQFKSRSASGSRTVA